MDLTKHMCNWVAFYSTSNATPLHTTTYLALLDACIGFGRTKNVHVASNIVAKNAGLENGWTSLKILKDLHQYGFINLVNTYNNAPRVCVFTLLEQN